MNTLDIKTDSNGIALITIDLKDRSMNVVSPEFIAEFDQAIDQVAGDENIKGAVVTSGKSSFVAGADLLQIVNEIDPGADPKSALAKWSGLQQLYRKLETCGKPFVAAINGTALGGGLELCLACHYRVAADNPKAKLGQPEVQVGLLPGAGGTQRLPRLIGLEASLPLLLQGTHLSPEKAAELGIVDLLVQPGEEVDAAKQWILDGGEAVQPWDKKGFKVPGGAGLMNPKAIQTQMFGVALLQKTTNHNYPAPIAIMSAVYEGSVLPIDTALQIESKYFAELLTDVVARNMIRTSVCQQRGGRQARTSSAGYRKEQGHETWGTRRRHDGRRDRVCVGSRRHAGRIARPQQGRCGKGQRLLAQFVAKTH